MSAYTKSTNPHLKLAVEMSASHMLQATEGTYGLADDQRFFDRATYIECRNVIRRTLMERQIVRSAATALLAAGYRLRVHDGVEFSCKLTDQLDPIMDAIMATDSDALVVYRLQKLDDQGERWTRFGGLSLIYGNDGWDVIADQTYAVFDEVLQDTNDFAEAVAEVL